MSRSSDLTILRCQGTAAERQIPYAALHQLLRPLLSELQDLPEHQRSALIEVMSFRLGPTTDRFAVPLAVLNLLSEHGRRKPLLVLVDDAHLIDHESAAILAFVATRVVNESVSLILTAQVVDDYAFAVHGIQTIDLPPLDALSTAALLFDRTGERPSPHVVDEVLLASLGNPKAISMLAVSLAADQVAGRAPLPVPLPIAPSHEAPLLARLRELPKATQTLLLIAALEESGDSMRLLAATQRLGLSVLAALEPAEGNGIIDVVGAAVVFREPLMREAVKRAGSFRDRRMVHLALAALLEADGDLNTALWHRAQATLGVNESLAVELEEAAGILRHTSSCATASKMLQRAAELSENGERKAFRLMLAGEVTWMSGQMNRTLALVDSAIAHRFATPSVRLRATFTRGHTLVLQGRMLAGIEAFDRIASDAEHLDSLTSIAANVSAARVAFVVGDLQRAGRFLRKAARLPGDETDLALQFGLNSGTSGYVTHDAVARASVLAEAATIAVDRGDPRWLMLASRLASCYGDSAAALRCAERALRVAREEGANGIMADLLMTVAGADASVHRRAAIEADAEEALRLAEEMGQDAVAASATALLGWVGAVQGRRADAEGYIQRCLRSSMTHGLSLYATYARRWLALLEIGEGNHQQAFTILMELQHRGRDVHPAVALWSVPELVEAGLRAQCDPATLAPAFGLFDQWATRHRSRIGLAMREHCRGLLLDGPEAIAAFESALRHHGQDRNFARARTQLAFGEALRRSRRRNDARVQLRAALDIFEMMGCASWARRARSELRASGESLRLEHSDEELATLTPQELQIAHLVGSGLSNREIAAQLFLSHRTVEYHLHKVFGKLDVSSRSELIRLVMETIDLSDGPSLERVDAQYGLRE